MTCSGREIEELRRESGKKKKLPKLRRAGT